MLYLCILIYAVGFAAFAMTVNEGLWNNTIALMALIVCGPLAVVLGYPVGLMLQEQLDKSSDSTWYFAFAGVWLVFCVAINLFRVIADRTASRVRMKFIPPLELAGGVLMALFVAAVFTSFVTFTLYSIPIRAGAWKYSDGSSWQQSTMRSGSGPFYAVLSAMAGDDVAKASMGDN